MKRSGKGMTSEQKWTIGLTLGVIAVAVGVTVYEKNKQAAVAASNANTSASNTAASSTASSPTTSSSTAGG